MTNRQLILLEYVKKHHGDQKRKYTGEPYWNHCVEVAKMVEAVMGNNHYLIEIALCHDLIEDTDLEFVDLFLALCSMEYSHPVCAQIIDGVEALTDVYTSKAYPALNRRNRKELEAARLSNIDRHFQTVKLADMISNSYSIIEHDPEFAKVYIPEKIHILNLMRKGHIKLYIAACEAVADYVNF